MPLGENRVHNRVECEPQKIIILNPGNLKQLFTAWALHPLSSKNPSDSVKVCCRCGYCLVGRGVFFGGEFVVLILRRVCSSVSVTVDFFYLYCVRFQDKLIPAI